MTDADLGELFQNDLLALAWRVFVHSLIYGPEVREWVVVSVEGTRTS
ncbi:hypothetical protein HFN67_32935 [Rhizobium laguerreae]|nr:hypothetical protein [Rhizobium laguerreae]